MKLRFEVGVKARAAKWSWTTPPGFTDIALPRMHLIEQGGLLQAPASIAEGHLGQMLPYPVLLPVFDDYSGRSAE